MKVFNLILLIIIVVGCNDQHEGNGIRPERRTPIDTVAADTANRKP